MTPDTLLTLDDNFDLPEKPGFTYELLQGRLVEAAKPGFGHKAMALECATICKGFCKWHFPHLLVGGDTEFLLSTGTVQAPDVVLLDRKTYESATTYRGALQCAPDLAVEIVSPHDSSADLDDKVGNYLESGTKTVWVLWPRRRHALVYHRGGSVQHVGAGQYLEAPESMPGAKVPLDDILQAIPLS